MAVQAVATTDADEQRSGYKVRALEALSEITTSLAGDTDLEDLLGRFLPTMIHLAGAEAGAVRVLTADESQLRMVRSIGLPPEALTSECYISIECGTCAESVTGDPGRDCHTEMRSCRERQATGFLGPQCRSVVPVPLSYRGRLLGVYNLFLRSDRTIPEDISMLFASIGEHLGMALENARLTRENLRATLASERQMLAGEVHDSLAQILAYMKMRLPLLSESVREGDSTRSEAYVSDLADALDTAYVSLRELLHQFRNPMDPRGLLPALEDLIAKFQDRTGIPCELVNNAPDLVLVPEQEIQVFHIAQEALANIHKHAQAERVHMVLDQCDGGYMLAVEDDGVGMRGLEAGPLHFGLSIMQERAQRLQGDLSVENRPGRGTRVVLRFPAALCRR